LDIDSLPLVQSPADSLDGLVTQYNDGIRSIIDQYTPLQTKTIVLRHFAPWRSFELRGLKAMARWAERMWQAAKRKRDPGSEQFQKVYRKHRFKYSTALDAARTDSVPERVSDCGGDMRALFQLVGDLTGSSAPPVLPDRPCMQEVVDDLSEFFSSKISTIRSNLDRVAESTSSHTLQHEQCFLQLHEENDLLATNLTMEAQVMKPNRDANFHLSRINKIRRFLSFFSVRCVVNALGLSRLDYCNSLYLNLLSFLLKRLPALLLR
jgi:hypothetical protein